MGEAGDGGSGNGSGEDDDSKPKNQPPASPAPRFDFHDFPRKTDQADHANAAVNAEVRESGRSAKRAVAAAEALATANHGASTASAGVASATPREQNPRASNSVAAKSVAKTAAKTAATAAEVGKAEDAGDATKESAMNQTKNVGFKAPAPVARVANASGIPTMLASGYPGRGSCKCRPPRRRIRSVARRWSAG